MIPTELADRIASGEKWAVDIHSCGYHCEIPGCMKAQRLELLARLDAAELDAARYRWLRHGDNDENIIAYPDEADTGNWLLRSKELDYAIDAAMKGKP